MKVQEGVALLVAHEARLDFQDDSSIPDVFYDVLLFLFSILIVLLNAASNLRQDFEPSKLI